MKQSKDPKKTLMALIQCKAELVFSVNVIVNFKEKLLAAQK